MNTTGNASDGEIEDYVVVIGPSAITVTGSIFYDNGVGKGTPHDGVKDAFEAGAPTYTVQAVDDATGEVIASAFSDGEGNYALNLPVTQDGKATTIVVCLLYTSPSPRDATLSRMPSSA